MIDLILKNINTTSFVFLHGFGSSAEKFQNMWFDHYPPKNCIFLNGLERDEFSQCYRWFPFTGNLVKLASYLLVAADLVEQKIANLPMSKVSLVGHSQGAMIALEILRRGVIRVNDVWSYSGFLPLLTLMEPRLTGKVNVHFLYSEGDSFIRKDYFTETIDYLKSINKYNVTIYRSTNLGHSFSSGWLDEYNFKQDDI